MCHFLCLQNDADYWLLSGVDVSITDMWRTDCILFQRYLFFPFCVHPRPIVFIFVLLFVCNQLYSFTTTIIAAIEWNGEDMLNADFGLPDVSTPRPQTPPSGIVEMPSHAANYPQR